jgi:hypothetical protein
VTSTVDVVTRPDTGSGVDRPEGGPESPRAEERLHRAVRIAWVVLGIQLVAMLLWSAVLYNRWSLTWDFAIRYQAWWGIAHGHLDPYSSVAHRYFWQDHFELINWPLAPFSRVWPGALWALWFQDLMVIGGELGALYLVVDAIRRPRWSGRLPGWSAVVLVTVLLVANPWIYDSISFDFHYQSVGAACFAMLACREMIRGRLRLLVLWVVLCLACGDIAGTYLAAVGLGGMLAGRTYRRRGAALLVLGGGWFVLTSAVGGGQGSGLAGHYGYLLPRDASGTPHAGVGGLVSGFVSHPGAVLQHLWSSRSALWAYASSSGGIGLFTPLSIFPLLILVESGAGQGSSLRSVAYENFGVLLFVAPLSVLALAWFADRVHVGRLRTLVDRPGLRWLASPALPRVVAVVLVGNALLWAVVWIPRVPVNWLRTSEPAASALSTAEQRIPQGAEVIASQGIVGRACGRVWCYSISADGSQTIPVHVPETYVLVAPYDGIESASVQTQVGIIGDLAGPLHATLVFQNSDIWLFRLPRGQGRTVTFAASPTEPAWATRTTTGSRQLHGPGSTWHLAQGRSAPGYALYGAEWNLSPGTYQATVTMASSGPAVLEVWDATAGVLLSRRRLPTIDAPTAVQADVQVTDQRATRPYSGWGPFSFLPRPGQVADEIEVRVWTDGSSGVSLYDVEMQRRSARPS